MKEFDLEAAKNGAPVCTRDGRKARILCFDLKHEYYPIVAGIDYGDIEGVYSYTADGHLYNNGYISSLDLMMAPVKHEG